MTPRVTGHEGRITNPAPLLAKPPRTPRNSGNPLRDRCVVARDASGFASLKTQMSGCPRRLAEADRGDNATGDKDGVRGIRHNGYFPLGCRFWYNRDRACKRCCVVAPYDARKDTAVVTRSTHSVAALRPLIEECGYWNRALAMTPSSGERFCFASGESS